MTTRKQNQKPEERPISKLIAAAKKPQNQTSGLPENQEVGETASTPPQLETQTDSGNNEPTEATSNFAETQKTSKPETQPKSKTRNSSTKPTASNTANQKNKKSYSQTTGKRQSKSSPSSTARNTKKTDIQINGLPENQITEPVASDIEGNEATPTTRKPENQIVESTSVIEAQDTDIKTVKPDTQINGLPESKIESSTMQETDTPVAAPAVSQASTTTDSQTVVVVKPENLRAVQPENQNKVSDSEPPEEQEPGVNICVKVPLKARRYWMGQSKMQGVTVTSVIVEALTQKFGKPPNQ